MQSAARVTHRGLYVVCPTWLDTWLIEPDVLTSNRVRHFLGQHECYSRWTASSRTANQRYSPIGSDIHGRTVRQCDGELAAFKAAIRVIVLEDERLIIDGLAYNNRLPKN